MYFFQNEIKGIKLLRNKALLCLSKSIHAWNNEEYLKP